MDDVAPKHKTTPREKIAQCLRMLSASERGVRVNAFTSLERIMQSEGVSWSDVGNWIDGSERDDGKYSENELQEFAQAVRAEGVEAGIKIGQARARNGGGSGGNLTLPSPAEMANFCQSRRAQLKDDNQRKFIDDMIVVTRPRMFSRSRLTPGRLGYLASIYIQNGGET